ncbi:sigma 54-interacting transcriptional regulator [Leptospira sp. GIMC2001]|uniref:sigma 54-interacting transcriptional regulator n=1 Tax=Leptospira sp. GIMC2001 TaxID=1513297 RepID=UPI00234A53A1|nr:sigma 54-interacting transcriptional regulator [Leptospira sp. GIMC2001]WCL50171.1 sigma 54-interacting transcriptional regulator [Leptospira sp. GIMC2001]
MYMQFLTLSFLIATMLCILVVIYCLSVRNKFSGLLELAISFSCLSLMYGACVYTSIELESMGALHRWVTVTSALISPVFFLSFFLKFPTPFSRNLILISFSILITISTILSIWFITETYSAPRVFNFNAHYWDFDSSNPGKIVAIYILFLVVLVLVSAIAQIIRHKKEKRIALIGILLSFFFSFLLPAMYLTMFRLGRVNAEDFVNLLAVSVLAGFFIFIIFFVSYGGYKNSIGIRVMTIILAMALFVTQLMSGAMSKVVENEFDHYYKAILASSQSNVPIGSVYSIPLEINSTEPVFRRYASQNLENLIVIFSDVTMKREVAFPYINYRSFVHRYVIDWAIILGICFIILSVGFLSFMKLSLLDPLNKLLKGVRRVEGGEFDIQLPVTSDDEIGQLTTAFNRMVVSVGEAREELRLYTSNLEKTIIERDSIFDASPHQKELENKTLIYASSSMKNLIERVERIATREQPVLIQGETGTGKEIIANLLHEIGKGRGKPFVPINCAAVPASLWESQIFGHVRGAFTDAKTDYGGLVAEAKGGTLFFDEVGEMTLDIQPKILRLLQERKYKAVGGRTELEAECRIIFATHRNLKAMVDQGLFREDLYYRINVFELRIPPLRERRSDIIFLINRFIESYSKQMNLQIDYIDSAYIDFLNEHPWPGNIRELENCIIKTLANVNGDSIMLKDLPPEIKQSKLSIQKDNTKTSQPALESHGFESMVATYSKRLIESTLERCNGNKSEAARLLKISRGKLQYQMKMLNME